MSPIADRPLRWLVLATHVPAGGGLGGIVRYTTELLGGLHRRGDVEVHVVGTRDNADTLASLVGDASRVYLAPSLTTPAMSVWERYLPPRRLVDAFDLVHGVKHLVPVRTRALRMLTVHDMLLLDRPRDFGLLKRALLPRPYRASVADADLLVCVSAATRARLLEQAPEVADRAVVAPLATSRRLLEAQPVPVAALRGRRFAIVVGDMSARKNVGTVVDAWPDVLEQTPDAVLALVGPPEWGAAHQGRAYDRLSASGAVRPLGFISDAELRWCYENAQVVLCPSLVEGFGLPAVEALDLGAPVLISQDPALGEAAAGRALDQLPATDKGAWAEAVRQAFIPAPHRRPVVSATRTYDDVVEDVVAAVQKLLPRHAEGGRRNP